MRQTTSTLAARLHGRTRTAVLLAAALLGAGLPGHVKAATESRDVSGFDEVLLAIPGDIDIRQGSTETLTLDAEPAVLRKITTERHGHRLEIAFVPGRVQTQQPIRVTLVVRSLQAFDSQAAGTAHIGPLRSDKLALALGGGSSVRLARLDGRSLDMRVTGAGTITIDAGGVATQRLAISGAGTYVAPLLASEHAEVAIDGQGDVRLAASAALGVRIAGVGQVRYRGNPTVTRAISGVGSIEKD